LREVIALVLFFAESPWAMRVVESLGRGQDGSKLRPLAEFFLSSGVPLVGHRSNFARPDRAATRQHQLRHWSTIKDLRRFTSACMSTDRGGDDELDEFSAEWSNSQAHRATQMGRADEVIKGLSIVWVLISNVGNSKECVYTMQNAASLKHVLVFEREADAERYAGLVSTDTYDVTPISWRVDQLNSPHYRSVDVAFVRQGQLVIPPAMPTMKSEPKSIKNVDRSSQKTIGHHSEVLQGISMVWVVVINPCLPNEGVYTLESPDTQVVLAFENKQDGKRFADKLQSGAGFGSAKAILWDSAELGSFCERGSLGVNFVSGGTIFDPPEVNTVPKFDDTTTNEHLNQSPNLQSRDQLLDSRTSQSENDTPNAPKTHELVQRNSGHPNQVLQGVSRSWIVMVNPGQQGEGVYTFENTESQVVLVFENREDGERFAKKLKTRAGYDATAPVEWDLAELKSFCEHRGFGVYLVSEGTSLDPPEINEYDTKTFSNSGGVTWRLHLKNQRALLEYLLSRGFRAF